VVQNQFCDDAQIASVAFGQKESKIVKASVRWMDADVIGNIVAVVPPRRRAEWQQPQGCDAKVLEVIQLFDKSSKVSSPISVAVVKGANVNFVDDRGLIPAPGVWGGASRLGCRDKGIHERETNAIERTFLVCFPTLVSGKDRMLDRLRTRLR
jgi:hypothetical protein